MANLKAARFLILKKDFSALRFHLLGLLHMAGFEPFIGLMRWRINDTLGEGSKVTIVAYNTGTVIVSGHGTKFDLTAQMVKTYDTVRAKSAKTKKCEETTK
jgi:hypothetical protein